MRFLYGQGWLLAALSGFLAAADANGKVQRSEHPIKPAVRLMLAAPPPSLAERFYGKPEAIRALREMLLSEAEEVHWPKAVTALGAIAPVDDPVVGELIDFLESSGPWSTRLGKPKAIFPALHEAKTRVPLALSMVLRQAKPKHGLPGGIAAVGGGQSPLPRALEYLIRGVEPGFWAGRVCWKSQPHYESDAERNLYLAQLAIQALGQCGWRQARLELEERQGAWKPDSPLGRAVADALAVARKQAPSEPWLP
jgi:hypothetical protein